MTDSNSDRPRYRLLVGPDDAEFCWRVSRELDDGYELYGSPTMTHGPEGPLVGQAIILRESSG